MPWRRKCQPIPAFLPGKFYGWRSLAGYSLWDCKRLDTTKRVHTHTHTHTQSYSTRGVRELGYSLPLPAISIIRWWREGCSLGINPLCCLVTKLCPTLLQPHGLSPARLCPWDFSGKNTGVGYHFLLHLIGKDPDAGKD